MQDLILFGIHRADTSGFITTTYYFGPETKDRMACGLQMAGGRLVYEEHACFSANSLFGSGRRDVLLSHAPLKTGHATFTASGLNHTKPGSQAQPAAQIFSCCLRDTCLQLPYPWQQAFQSMVSQFAGRVEAAFAPMLASAVICFAS
jgi:hypothetical protein